MDRAEGKRRLPIGAEVRAGGGAHFRVWAPRCRRVDVVLASPGEPIETGESVSMTAEPGGYFSVEVPNARAGALYAFRLDGGEPLPDPASRFQPHGPHGPSELIDPAFPWTDDDWRGVPDNAVFYEMHVGTYTREGTWAAAERHLDALADLGITVIELMPVADFSGRFGWGYDGVNMFAPTRLYGRPEDFRRFVDRAHGLGMAVILDVVYNHLGPDGNHLAAFSPAYFTDRYHNEWGDAINFDGDDAGPVREFFLANAEYWIAEFHLDGFRLDATQQIFDESGDPIVAGVVRAVRRAAGGRATIVVAENEPQNAGILQPPERGGWGVDAIWNDDFHHAARVALTGRSEAYYSDYRGTPQELVSTAKRGFLYQGQYFTWQRHARGTPAFDVRPRHFVHYLENHDQVANSLRGERLHRLTAPDRYRALTALLLLAPASPLLFQGQEFAASAPFSYFADHRPGLADRVRRGRLEFLSQFPEFADPAAAAALPDPCSPHTFERCKLDHTERDRNAEAVALHRDLLRLRRTDPVFSSHGALGLDGAVLAQQAFLLRFFGGAAGDRLLIVNLGGDLVLAPAPEPLLAPPSTGPWQLRWSSNDVRYGGPGTPQLDTRTVWTVPAGCALVLVPPAPDSES